MATDHGSRRADALAVVASALPEGAFEAMFEDARWVVTSTRHAGGAARTIEGRRLDRREAIGGNLYATSHGWVARPCEVPAARFEAFVLGLRPVAARTDPGKPLVRRVGPIEALYEWWGWRRIRRRARRELRR